MKAALKFWGVSAVALLAMPEAPAFAAQNSPNPASLASVLKAPMTADQCTAMSGARPPMIGRDTDVNHGDYKPSIATGATRADAATRLLQLDDAPTQIYRAELVPAANGVQEYCRLKGVVAPQTGFEIRLPTHNWNGKLLMQGCGGQCGIIYDRQLEEGLSRNYAVAHTNMGHDGQTWLFAYNNLQGKIDFGYRSTHITAKAAKEIVDIFYGTKPKYSYFNGCSTGGRQAMVEAQRYPKDFDGIISGAPPIDLIRDGVYFVLGMTRDNVGPDGRGILDSSKLSMIHIAVMKACDGLDGLKDGLLMDPRQCKWDPAAIQCAPGEDVKACLTAPEVAVVRKIYSGPTDAKGRRLFYGMPRGSEYIWDSIIGTNGNPGDRLRGGPIATQFLSMMGSYYGDRPVNTDPTHANYELTEEAIDDVSPLYNALNPDLSRFRDAGGKLMLYHGWDDDQIPIELSTTYYETAMRTMGGAKATQEFFRYFAVPAMGHCRLGPGGDGIDYISAMEDWVERGIAPEQLTAYHLTAKQNYLGIPRPVFPLKATEYDRSRPIFPFPAVAKWSGKGDPKDGANWVAKIPKD